MTKIKPQTKKIKMMRLLLIYSLALFVRDGGIAILTSHIYMELGSYFNESILTLVTLTLH